MALKINNIACIIGNIENINHIGNIVINDYGVYTVVASSKSDMIFDMIFVMHNRYIRNSG